VFCGKRGTKPQVKADMAGLDANGYPTPPPYRGILWKTGYGIDR